MKIPVALLAFMSFSTPSSALELDEKENDSIYQIDDSIYHVGSIQPRSVLFENKPHYKYLDTQIVFESEGFEKDTLELPEKSVRPSATDSFSKEFKKYWVKVEEQEGFDKLRNQMRSNDIMKSRLPRLYLFDSSLVIFPFPPTFIWGKENIKKK